MAGLSITWADIEGLRRFEKMLSDLDGPKFQRVVVRALNRTGDMAKTQVTRGLAKQTGLKRVVIVKAFGTPKPARVGDLSYEMKARGGDIALKYFAPRETRRGVSAQPFGQRKVFAHTFLKAGWWPHRVPKPNWHGQVFLRSGKGTFEKQKSGVVIPVEMVTGATAQAFEQSVKTNLPKRVEHELKRLSGGALS